MKYCESNSTSIGIIIQARLGSKRLPQKMILPFYNELGVLDIIIDKIKNFFPKALIILATSEKKENDLLEEKALLKGCKVFRGDENDVLKRFCDAAEMFGVSRLIRICADNPFLDMIELSRLVNFANEKNVDYASFNVNGLPSIKTHFGFWAEYTTLEALKRVRLMTNNPFYQEHVTNFIYENPSIFKIELIEPNTLVLNQNEIRLTLDTAKDFKLLANVYSELYSRYKSNFGIDEVLIFLNENRFYKEEMKLEIIKNSK